VESDNLDAIASELQRLRNQKHQQATALRSDLWTVEKLVARIDAALVALSGEATKADGNGHTAKKTKRTLETPSAKKSDVIAAMRRFLEKEEVTPVDALRKQVEALLTEDGFNRFGFAMRWKEAIQDSQFVVTPEGLKLSTATSNDKLQPRELMARNSANGT
jgi:hypothetical protein